MSEWTPGFNTPASEKVKIGYKQLTEQIGCEISAGILPPGFKMPTVRALARSLTITPTTVSRAYKLAEQQGLLIGRVGKGTFVTGAENLSAVIQPGQTQCNLSIIQPNVELAQTELNRAITAMAKHQLNAQLLSYPDENSLEPYKHTALLWLQQQGIEANTPAKLNFAHGAQHVLKVLISILSSALEKIAVEQLTYPGIPAICRMLDRKMVSIAMDEFGVIPQALEQACNQDPSIKVLVLVASYQNPTAAIMPFNRRQELIQVARKHRLWIIDDDIYGFLNKNQVPSLSSIAPDICFYISSLSKCLFPGLRVGYIYGPEQKSELIASYIRTSIWMCSPLSLELADYLISSGDAKTILGKQMAEAGVRQKLTRQILGEFELISQLRSYHVWLKLPEPWGADSFTQEAKKLGVLVSSASYFSTQRGWVPPAIRLSIMAPKNREQLEQGLIKLKILLRTPVLPEF